MSIILSIGVLQLLFDSGSWLCVLKLLFHNSVLNKHKHTQAWLMLVLRMSVGYCKHLSSTRPAYISPTFFPWLSPAGLIQHQAAEMLAVGKKRENGGNRERKKRGTGNIFFFSTALERKTQSRAKTLQHKWQQDLERNSAAQTLYYFCYTDLGSVFSYTSLVHSALIWDQLMYILSVTETELFSEIWDLSLIHYSFYYTVCVSLTDLASVLRINYYLSYRCSYCWSVSHRQQRNSFSIYCLVISRLSIRYFYRRSYWSEISFSICYRFTHCSRSYHHFTCCSYTFYVLLWDQFYFYYFMYALQVPLRQFWNQP